jgi:hypothetical protein
MRTLAAFLFLVCLTGCGALLTPDQRAELRERAAAERQLITDQLQAGEITEAEARDRFLFVDGTEFGIDLEERVGDGTFPVDELVGTLLGIGLGIAGIPAVGYVRRRQKAARVAHDDELAAKVVKLAQDAELAAKEKA